MASCEMLNKRRSLCYTRAEFSRHVRGGRGSATEHEELRDIGATWRRPPYSARTRPSLAIGNVARAQ